MMDMKHKRGCALGSSLARDGKEPRTASKESRSTTRESRSTTRKPRPASRKPRSASRKPRSASKELRAASRKSCVASREPRAVAGKSRDAAGHHQTFGSAILDADEVQSRRSAKKARASFIVGSEGIAPSLTQVKAPTALAKSRISGKCAGAASP